jgi:hypothetical protein
MQYLLNWPISFGEYSSESTPIVSTTVCSLYDSDLTAAARSLSCFNWVVYGFNSGHFISSIRSLGLPFAIVLASDEYAHSRSLFTELSACTGPTLGGCRALLDHIKASGITSKFSRYLVHSRHYNSTKRTSRFWQLQAASSCSSGSPACSQSSLRVSTQTRTVAQSPFNSSINSNWTGGSSLIR